MKKLIYISFIFAFILAFTSCEKEVIQPKDVDTNSSSHYRGDNDNGSFDNEDLMGHQTRGGDEDGDDGGGDDDTITDPDEDEDFDEEGQGITDPDEDEDFEEEGKGGKGKGK